MMGASLGAGQAVARGLKVSRTTSALVAGTTSAVVANAMVAMQEMSTLGQFVMLAVVFAFVAFAVSSVSADLVGRSSQTVSNLRSIGATKGAMFAGLLGFTVTWGVVGAVLGVALGGVVGAALLASPAPLFTLAVDAVLSLAVAAAATSAGVYFGVGLSWRS